MYEVIGMKENKQNQEGGELHDAFEKITQTDLHEIQRRFAKEFTYKKESEHGKKKIRQISNTIEANKSEIEGIPKNLEYLIGKIFESEDEVRELLDEGKKKYREIAREVLGGQ